MTDMAERKKGSPAAAVIGLIVLGALAWYFFGGGLEKQTTNRMQQIYDQVTADSVKRYAIAKRNGTLIDACVQAGLVSAAFLQAKNEPEYQKWKKIEAADCVRAGVPR